MKSRYFFYLFIIVMTISCEEIPLEEITDPIQEKYPGVDENLWSYFSSFEEEAAIRGLQIDLATSGITAEFADLPQLRVAGQCTYNYLNPGKITIDIPFWSQSNDQSRELVVFHELGHCYLNREHLNTAFSNGICRSIMRSGDCCCQDAYNDRNRSYFLDELFSLSND